MDTEKLFQQGREMADKLRGTAGEQVAQHEEQIKQALQKFVTFVNEKTEGKYTDQVNRAIGFVEQGVELLASQASSTSTPTDDQGADHSTPPSSGTPTDPAEPTTPPAQSTPKPDQPPSA